MIELLIYHLHIIAAVYAFTKNWRLRGLRYGFLAIIIIGLLFTIGWALTSPIAELIMPHAAKNIYFNKSTLSLVILLIPEIFFFYTFFLKDKPEVETSEIEK